MKCYVQFNCKRRLINHQRCSLELGLWICGGFFESLRWIARVCGFACIWPNGDIGSKVLSAEPHSRGLQWPEEFWVVLLFFQVSFQNGSERLVNKLDSVFVEGHLIFFFVGHVRVEGTELSFFGIVLVDIGSGGCSENPVSQIHHWVGQRVDVDQRSTGPSVPCWWDDWGMAGIVDFHFFELFGDVIKLVFLICWAVGFSSLVAPIFLNAFAIADDHGDDDDNYHDDWEEPDQKWNGVLVMIGFQTEVFQLWDGHVIKWQCHCRCLLNWCGQHSQWHIGGDWVNVEDLIKSKILDVFCSVARSVFEVWSIWECDGAGWAEGDFSHA